MIVAPLEIGMTAALRDNIVYFLIHRARNEAAVVDPGEERAVLDFLSREKLELRAILLTHHHQDHIAAAEPLMKRFKVPVFCSARDHARIPYASRGMGDNERLNVLGTEGRVLTVPGHTEGQIAYYFEPLKAVFVGDTLYSAGCGRLREGNAEQLFNSLKRLRDLPDDTRVYFGHEYTIRNLEFVSVKAPRPGLDEYRREVEEKIARGEFSSPTTIAREKRINPFLMAESLEEFRALRLERDRWPGLEPFKVPGT
jgi:hydroxyacylglutathione hydrolase